MPAVDLPLRCRCGEVRGIARDVGPRSGLRFFCYCADCRAFARFLERTDVLDSAGGTDIFQMPPANVAITAGGDSLRCVKLSANVLRWYTDCCRSPIGNSATTARFPIAAIIHSFMDHESDGRSRDAVLGAPRCRIFSRSALGPLPPSAPPPPSLSVFALRTKLMLRWLTRGLAKPSPFFEERSGAARSKPRELPETDRAALRD